MWCSLGTIGLTGEPSTSARVALLPPWWLLPLLIATVFAAIRFLRLSAPQQSVLFGSAPLLLPWLPIPVPPAALLWTGPFMVAVWVAVVGGVLIARSRASSENVFVGTASGRWLTDERRAPITAAALALLLYASSALWLSSIFPDGDEPHYLILAQSLIKDGDLRIENNHRRGDYVEYSLNAAAPDYLRRGLNGEIYSIHAPGLAVLIAPAMWLFGYPGVVAFLACIAAISTGLVWYVGYRATGDESAAWFGWACCALTAPFFFQATEVFPDGIAATCALLGTLPLTLGTSANGSDPNRAARARLDERMWLLAGLSLAILPWLQTRLSVLAIGAALCLLFRAQNRRQIVMFAGAPLLSAAIWFGFFMAVYGTPNPTAPYGSYTQTSIGNLFRGFPGLLFDQQFGLIPNAPVYGFVVLGILAATIRLRRWGWETLVLTVPYMTAVGSYQMWWGGTSVPARLLAPLSLILGVAASRVWRQIQRPATKAVALLALAASAVITATLLGPEHGRLLLNFRDGISLWLEWANKALDLPKALPSLFRDDPVRLWLKTLIWAITLVTMWLVLRVVAPRSMDPDRSMGALALQSTWCAAVALMIASTLSWRLGGAQPLTPETSEVALLQHISPFRPLAWNFKTSGVEASQTLRATLHLASDHQRRPSRSPTLFTARDVPAGSYELRVTSAEPAKGTLAVRIGSTPLPLLTTASEVAQTEPARVRIELPVSVRSLAIDGDDAAVRTITAIRLAPVERPGASPLGAARGSAPRAAHYGSAGVFFLDENAYPEATGFWVAGGRTAVAIIASHGGALGLFLRNAPVDNRVTLDVEGESHELTLGAGEERLITLPLPSGSSSARVSITSRNGFRPSETEPGSSDQRYLGCWIETR